MKRVFAVVLLLLSFASAAWADGSGQEPPPTSQSAKPPASASRADQITLENRGQMR